MPHIPVQLCLSGKEVTDTRVRPGGKWVSGVLSEPGDTGTTYRLVMWQVADPILMVELLADPMPLSGRGLSGGVHVWHPSGDVVCVATRTSGMVAITLEGTSVVEVRQLPLDASRSWFTPDIGAHTSLYAIADWQELWSCNLESGEVKREFGAVNGFALDAAAGASGLCHTWSRPHMPWTTSSLWPDAPVDNVAVQQPRFCVNGESFGFVTDIGGVANVCIVADGVVDADVIIEDSCEHGGPVWGQGQRTWCFNSTGTHVAYTRNENGFGSLWVYDRESGERTFVGRGIHGCLSWDANTLTALRSGARTPQQVVVYDMSNVKEPVRTVLVRVEDALWSECDSELVEPTLHEAISEDGTVVPYRMYQAAHESVGIIVWVHGGPTDQWQITFRPRLTYWLSRGWSIAVVDHRGTTGHGREFAMALHGHWGEHDATDTLAVVHAVNSEFGFEPQQIVLMGGSAGGLTVLNTVALAPESVSKAVVSYPVVDLAEILQGDDPFETHYMPQLIGSDDPESELVRERSPLAKARALARVPLLVFHGDMDTSVPLVHSQKLRDAVVAAGGTVQLVVMEGEGHGFKQPENVTREFDLTEAFISG